MDSTTSPGWMVLGLLKMTSGTRPFPNVIPKYIKAKVDRYTRYLRETDEENAELESRMLDTLHNADEEERQREAAMMASGSCVKRAESTPYLRQLEMCWRTPCWHE